MRLVRSFASPALLVAPLLAASSASAAPSLRHQADLHGDVVVLGSSLAFDCGAGVSPPEGSTAICAGQNLVADTAPDLYWRDATASSSVAPTQARTSATLELPAGATVRYARLYWAALKEGDKADLSAVLDREGGKPAAVKADASWVLSYGFPDEKPNLYYYQASADVTAAVVARGPGAYRVSDVEALPLAGVSSDRAFSAWTLVVFYEHEGEDLRNLAVFDGFTSIDPEKPGQEKAEVTLSGFVIPQGFSARMTAFTYEGDESFVGDYFSLDGKKLDDFENPVDNFFNSSRSFLGAPVSGELDVPRLSGSPGSMAGYDLDTVDITSRLIPSQKSMKIGAGSTKDIFLLGGFVTSVTSLTPDFATLEKKAEDVNGGEPAPGDEIVFSITASNTGNDPSIKTVLTDVLDPGFSYVPGSLEVSEGIGAGAKTDAAGDDEGEYDASSRTVTVRLGSGATASAGGSIPAGGSVVVRFRVKVEATAGDVANQASLYALGKAGGEGKTYLSDGDLSTPEPDPTVISVAGCASDADCPEDKPLCDPDTHACLACASDADCPDPAKPACQPDGSCGACSATNDTLCGSSAPACDVDTGTCVLCTPGPDGDASACVDSPDGPVCVVVGGAAPRCGCDTDEDCGDGSSGLVCDPEARVCVSGCRGEDGNGCPAGETCTSSDASIGECVGQAIGEEGGCGCVLPGRNPKGLAPLAALLALAGLGLRRRGRSGGRLSRRPAR